jgi:hypothetical protein
VLACTPNIFRDGLWIRDPEEHVNLRTCIVAVHSDTNTGTLKPASLLRHRVDLPTEYLCKEHYGFRNVRLCGTQFEKSNITVHDFSPPAWRTSTAYAQRCTTQYGPGTRRCDSHQWLPEGSVTPPCRSL